MGKVDNDLRELLEHAVAEHKKIPGASWPPTEEQLNAFKRSLNGVRLSGDRRTENRQRNPEGHGNDLRSIPVLSGEGRPTLET
jgi:hypothetical protein